MANKFSFEIVALDKFSKVFRNLNNNVSKAMRPVTTAQRQFGQLAREMHLDKLTKGFRGLSQATLKVASNMGLAAGPMEAILGVGVVGGLVATAGAVAALGTRWGNLGFETKRTSEAIGISTDDLQKYRGAAKLAGVSADAMTESLAGIATAMQSVRSGNNPQLGQFLHALGINDTDSNEAVMKKVSDLLHSVTNPQLRQKVADVFMLNPETLPLLNQGSEALEKLKNQAAQFGVVAGGSALDGAEKFGESMNRLKTAIEGVANSWGQKLTPMLTRGADLVTNSLESKGVGGSLWDVFNGKLARDFAFDGAAPGMQKRSGLVTNDSSSGPVGINLNPGGSQSRVTPQEQMERDRESLRYLQNDVDTQTDPAVRAATEKALARRQASLLSGQPFSEGKTSVPAASSEQNVNIHVAVSNAPPGTRVSSTGAGANGLRVSYALPPGDAP